MRTWSIESVLRGLEKLTRPPRRTGGFDEDAAAAYLHDVGATLSDKYRPAYEAAKARKYPAVSIPWPPEADNDYDDDPMVSDSRLRYDDTPNPTEPGLDDSELIGVRGLLQERYEDSIFRDQSERADTQDAQMWRAYVKTSPAASAAGDSPSDACDIPPSPSEGRRDPISAPHLHDDQCESEFIHGPMAYSPCACSERLAQVSASDQVLKLEQTTDDAAAEWIGGAVPVIQAVLDEHMLRPDWNEVPVCQCMRIFNGAHEWREHVAPLIANALAPQPKPAFPETGLDMGDRLDGASAMYPQHTRHQK